VATAEGTALTSVDRALRLLEELARHGPLGATELANRTGCAKATAFRLARTLQARGFVVQNQDSSYRLGPRCLLLATGVHTSFDVRREALPAMEALREGAEKGDLDSQKLLAAMLEGGVTAREGPGVAANPREAFMWYEKAAQSGDKEALKRLGILYAVGRGAPKDPDKALDAFRRSGFDVDGYLERVARPNGKHPSKSIEAWMVAFFVDLNTRVSQYPRDAVRHGDSGTVILRVDTATRAVEVLGGTAPDALRAVVRETAARGLILLPPPDDAASAELKVDTTIDYRLH
jgi:DNA-binding MarR family transcriptional regulator